MIFPPFPWCLCVRVYCSQAERKAKKCSHKLLFLFLMFLKGILSSLKMEFKFKIFENPNSNFLNGK